MNYHQYIPVDVINGPGTRCTLFVSGCEHQCKGCYNQGTWRPSSGHLFTPELADQIIKDLNDTRIIRRGLSLSGGDPLHPANLNCVLSLVKRVKMQCPQKDIWLWSGYIRDALTKAQQEVLDWIDVFIDGPFIQEKADARLDWRGSSNQVIYYLTNKPN